MRVFISIDDLRPATFLAPFLAQFDLALLHEQGRTAGTMGMTFKEQGRSEHADDGVADELVERAAVVVQDVGHLGKVVVHQARRGAQA
jgi:hypothetical protein